MTQAWWWSWFSIGLPVVSCAVNIAFAVRFLRLARRNDRRVEALRVLSEDTIKSLLPAVAFCVVLAEDEGVPQGVREMARRAIPPKDVVSITKGPLTTSGSPRVH